MNKVIQKKKIPKLIFSFIIIMFLSVICFQVTPFKAHAAGISTPYYSMEFDYTITTTSGGGGGAGTTTSNGTGYSVSFATSSGTCTSSVSIYGSEYSGTGQFTKGSYIRSSTINIAISSNKNTGSIRVTNSSGTDIGTGSGSLSLSGLSDGLYNVTFGFGSGAWATSARSGMGVTCTGSSSFRVDCTAPSITGASTSTTGKVVNSAFTVSASDSGSGVENLYMKGPNDSSYMACGTSKTVSAGSVNGLYQFYAKDRAGNTSATYYVYYDTAKPTVGFYTSGWVKITSGGTNGAFFATASDSGLGVNYMQYKRPSDTSWQSYTAQTNIAATEENGTYMFRAVDLAGNVCDTYMITLDSGKPVVIIYGGTNTVSNGGATKADYIKFVASDALSDISAMYVKLPNASSYSSYSAGTQLTTIGKYYFYCTDSAGNTSDTYSITLDNTAPVIACSQIGFYETTEYDFTVSASDNVSAVTLYYKTPLMDSFLAASGNSYSVLTTDSDGKYYFYAEDALGNKSETKWIELNVAKPTATIERDKNTNKYRITWDGSSTGRLNDNPYTKGTWISEEGEYTFVITNSSNRSNTYHFTIAHAFVVVEVVPPTCTERGYSVYKCLSCDITYNANYVDANGHDYESVLVGETCTEGAYYLYTCKVCGHQYKSEYLTQGGHKYTTKTTAPTCTERGYTTYTCSVFRSYF